MLTTYQNWQLKLDDAAVLWLGLDKVHASTNTLNAAIFTELAQILTWVLGETAVKALVIHSLKSSGFIAGADIEQFSQLSLDAEVLDLIRHGQAVYSQLASLPLPTVALIDGFCLGGGLELALACRYRIAATSVKTRLGLPEVLLGIHPGWGGTVRLPALLGAPKAMAMLLSGRSVAAKAALHLGLVDAVVPRRQLMVAAQTFALSAPPVRRPGYLARCSNAAWLRPLLASFFKRKLRQKVKEQHYPAAFAMLESWQKWGVSGTEAYFAEAQSLMQLQRDVRVKNCLRAFSLQTELKRSAKSLSPLSLHHVHVVGAGTMGGDIAAWCALQGYRVTLQDRHANAIAPAMRRAHALFKAKLKERLLIQAAVDRLQADVAGDGIIMADVIIEAIFEDLSAKQELFKQLEQRAKSTALLATNTSSIALDAIAQVMQQPERLVGVHFFNPVSKMLLVEVVAGQRTTAEVIETALALVRKIDKLPLLVKSSPGFLINRVLMPYLMECMALLDDGFAAEAIDAAALRFGMPMGPVELADSVGLDICLSVATNLASHLGSEVPQRLMGLVEAQHLGRKTGQGFYCYRADRALKAKVALDTVSYEKISTRLVYRLLNESIACVREGVVANEDLLDAGMIFATGFAPFRGGPLHYARQLGEQKVLANFQSLLAEYGPRFKPDVAWLTFFVAS